MFCIDLTYSVILSNYVFYKILKLYLFFTAFLPCFKHKRITPPQTEVIVFIEKQLFLVCLVLF